MLQKPYLFFFFWKFKWFTIILSTSSYLQQIFVRCGINLESNFWLKQIKTNNSNKLKQFVGVEVTWIFFSLCRHGTAHKCVFKYSNGAISLPSPNVKKHTLSITKEHKSEMSQGNFYDLDKQQQQQIPKYLSLPDFGNLGQKAYLVCVCSQLAHFSTMQ